MPTFGAIDISTVRNSLHPMPRIECQNPLFISNRSNLVSTIRTNELSKFYNITDVDQVSCDYAEIKRRDDNSNRISDRSFAIELRNITEVNSEFIRVECKVAENKIFYKDFQLFAPVKYSPEGSPFSEGRVSVLVIGVSTLSRLNFHRDMPLTSKALLDELGGIELQGYNKVGEDAYANMIPALTGLDTNELSGACLPNGINSTYDKCPFIWRRFRDRKFQTVFAENIARHGLFNSGRQGFNATPTDYYLRPIMLEMEKANLHNKKGGGNMCLGSHRPSDILLEYLEKLIPNFLKDYFFSFFWLSSVNHHFLSMPALIDEDMRDLIMLLNRTGVLNTTIVFFMSDRGSKASSQKTYQGIMEERLPLLLVLLPQWFNITYPLAAFNLKQNAKKLTSHFDLHATLVDLLNLKSLSLYNIRRRSSEFLDGDSLPRGISLFLNIPNTRNCEKAGIASIFCTCYKRRKIVTNDARVQRVARFIVHHINKMLNPYPQCRSLYLNSIFEASIGSSESNVLREPDWNVLADITTRLQTKPGFAEYQATVRVFNEQMNLTGTIRLVNSYPRQGYCIDDYAIKMFCYCEK